MALNTPPAVLVASTLMPGLRLAAGTGRRRPPTKRSTRTCSPRRSTRGPGSTRKAKADRFSGAQAPPAHEPEPPVLTIHRRRARRTHQRLRRTPRCAGLIAVGIPADDAELAGVRARHRPQGPARGHARDESRPRGVTRRALPVEEPAEERPRTLSLERIGDDAQGSTDARRKPMRAGASGPEGRRKPRCDHRGWRGRPRRRGGSRRGLGRNRGLRS